MSRQRSSSSGRGRGVLIAGALSAVFMGITVVTSPLTAALVVLPIGMLVGGLRARSVPKSTPHSLVGPKLRSVSVIRAPRSTEAINTKGAAPAA